MQNHHISGGRAYYEVAISFRFRDIGHTLFFPRERGKIFEFHKILIIPVMWGTKRKPSMPGIIKTHFKCILSQVVVTITIVL